MTLYTFQQSVLDAIVEYCDWGSNPTKAPCPLTIKHKWEGPMMFYFNKDTPKEYPVIVLHTLRWPQIRFIRLNQYELQFDAVITVLVQATTGNNPHELARETACKIAENLSESNCLGLGDTNGVLNISSINTPPDDMYELITRHGGGDVSGASISLSFIASWTVHGG